MTGEGGVLDTETSCTGTLEADKREKTYVLSVQDKDAPRSFTGEYLFEKDEISLSVSGATVGGEAKKLSLAFCLKAQDRAPEMPAYLNVVQMDVTRFTPIYTRATAASSEFLVLWSMAAFTPRGVLSDVLKMAGLLK